jgi:hypothetical protein
VNRPSPPFLPLSRAPAGPPAPSRSTCSRLARYHFLRHAIGAILSPLGVRGALTIRVQSSRAVQSWSNPGVPGEFVCG